MLTRFVMEYCHGVLTPMDPNIKLDLTQNQGEKQLEDLTDYQAVMRSLLNTALPTRPDILYVVATLSLYNSQPFTSHITAAKSVLQYLQSTADFGLHFNSNGIGSTIGSTICFGIGIGVDINNSLVE